MIDETRLYLAEVERVRNRAELGSLERHLVDHALIKIYAAFESEIRGAVVERCSTGDDARDRYVIGVVERSVRISKTSDLAGVLGNFSEECKGTFQEWIKSNDQARTAYENIINNRHAIAHEANPRPASWRDIQAWWDEACPVVDAFQNALDPSSN